MSNYAANFQVFSNLGPAAKFPAAIKSGVSNTVFFAERYAACGTTLPTPGYNVWGGADPSLGLTNLPTFGIAGQYFYPTTSIPMFQNNPTVATCNPAQAQTPHTGGMVVCMGDGSTRTVSPGLSLQTWNQVCNPLNSSPVGPDW